MSYGLVCLRCRAYLSMCRCERPIPSENARTPIEGAEGGVDRDRATALVQAEKAVEIERERRVTLPRAERRRLEREELKQTKRALKGLRR